MTAPLSGLKSNHKRAPPAGRSRHRSSIGLAWYLLASIAAVTVPLLVLCAGAVWYDYHVERERYGEQLVEYARSLARLVDREIERAGLIGLTLARSNSLARGDMPAFHGEMRTALEILSAGGPTDDDPVSVSLWDRAGGLIHSTVPTPVGATLSAPPHVQRALASGRQEFPQLIKSAMTGRQSAEVVTPVRDPITGDITYAISIAVPSARLSAMVALAGLPVGAMASIQDRSGATVARGLQGVEGAGRLPVPFALDSIIQADSGLLSSDTVSLGETGSVVAFARALASGFIAEVSVTESVSDAPFRTVLWRDVPLGLLFVATGGGLACYVSRRIVTAFRAVPASSEAMTGSGYAELGIREANELAALLSNAMVDRDMAAAETLALLNSSPVGIIIMDEQGAIRAVNDAFLVMLGVPRAQAGPTALKWEAILRAEDVSRHRGAITATLDDQPPSPSSYFLYRADGSSIPTLVSYGRTSQRADLVSVFVIDLTNLRTTETALQDLVTQQRLFIDRAPAAIAMFDTDMRYIAVSRRFISDYNLRVTEPADMLGRSHYEFFPDVPEHWRAIHRQVLAGETLSNDDEAFPRADGTTDWLRWEMSPWRHPDGRIGGAVLFSEVITDRKATEEALRRSEANMRQIVEASPTGKVMTNAAGLITMANREAERIFGRDRADMVGQPLEILIPVRHRARHAIDHTRFRANPVARTMGPGRNLTALRADGTEVPVEIGLSPIESQEGPVVLATIVDITERRLQEEALARSEEQLRQAQKMEAIGNLTGGMAHDFNNLLGVIIGNLELARRHVSEKGDAPELLDEALDAALRGGDLTQRLLAFARRQPLSPRPVDLNDLVTGMAKLLRRTLGEDLVISLDLAPDLWGVIADPTQVEAALANLANNARDAMPDGGELRIRTGNRVLDDDYASLQPDVRPGEYAMISVSDTGTGMTAEVTGRIFEPFYTTKEPGKGTGLGLSMVFGFMKQSGGHISAYSEPGLGSTFHLFLPRDDEPAGATIAADNQPQQRGYGEAVLVVEDNAALRRVVTRQLVELGYQVIGAATANEALDRLATDRVDVLFTDIVMPGSMSGFALARRVMLERPAIKIVLTSGFPDVRGGWNADSLAPSVRMLTKPHRRIDLARVMREVLDG